jgi:hypothetical protein
MQNRATFLCISSLVRGGSVENGSVKTGRPEVLLDADPLC